MSKPYTRPSTPDDCAELALSMRQADRTEIALGGSSGPYESLMRGLANSDTCESIIAPNGAVVGMAGVVRLSPMLGSPWMLAADALSDIRMTFLRECRDWLAAKHAQYPHLYNEVWEGNTTHIRWLKWLGFTVSETPGQRAAFLPFWKSHV